MVSNMKPGAQSWPLKDSSPLDGSEKCEGVHRFEVLTVFTTSPNDKEPRLIAIHTAK